MFTVRVDRPTEGLIIIAGIGEIDSLAAPKLSASLHRELERNPAVLVLDLTGVGFLGVAGLQVLECAAAWADTLPTTLKLVHHEHSPVHSALRAGARAGLFPNLHSAHTTERC